MDVSRVQQSKDNNCFDACIEMLTGIDQDLFNPDDTLAVVTGCAHLMEWMLANGDTAPFEGRRIWHEHNKAEQYSIELHDPSIFMAWKIFFDLNGYVLKKWHHQPSIPAIAVVNCGTHAVVQLPNGLYVDPAGFSFIYAKSDLWFTITEKGNGRE